MRRKCRNPRRNRVHPWDVINQHGADAMRWYLYTASPPGQERRFSSDLVKEVVRGFTMTLWNTYSFFVTYANLDGWKPEPDAKNEYSPLDKWLRSALHTLVRDVTYAYENYDLLGATRPIEIFVDQLSNWFLRRSRRRFWKSESDGDKQAAYATLYEALVTLSKLLAPAMPFIADEMYQNLVRSFEPDAPISVHLADWPVYDPSLIDEKLNHEMTLVMKLASLGLAARNKAKRTVRQPLQEAAFAVGNADDQGVVEKYADLLEDELNVKHVRILQAAGESVSFSLNPLPKQLGQKYGSKFPAIRQAILSLDSTIAGPQFLGGEGVSLKAGDEEFTILADEVEVRMQAREGYAVASEGAYLAALVTELTPELVQEGMAREFVRRVQDLRKTAEFEIADRIVLYFDVTPGLAKALKTFGEYICNETLTVEMKAGPVPEGLPVVSDELDEGREKLTVAIQKASK